MALSNTKKVIFVNLSKGKFIIKIGDRYETYDNLTGRLTGVEIRIDEVNKIKFEVVVFSLVDNNDTYKLKLRCDSGYFRNLCNALKNANLNKIIKFSPTYKEINGKAVTGMYVIQDEKALKHAHTKDNLGDCPPLEWVTFKGKGDWDNTKQLEYWKNWLKSLKFESISNDNTDKISDVQEVSSLPEENEDLPF